MRRFLLVLPLVLPLLLASAPLSAFEPRGGMRQRQGPPQESFWACRGVPEGDPCSFPGPRGMMNGVCASVREGFLCVPEHLAPRRGERDQPRPPEEQGMGPEDGRPRHEPEPAEPPMIDVTVYDENGNPVRRPAAKAAVPAARAPVDPQEALDEAARSLEAMARKAGAAQTLTKVLAPGPQLGQAVLALPEAQKAAEPQLSPTANKNDPPEKPSTPFPVAAVLAVVGAGLIGGVAVWLLRGRAAAPSVPPASSAATVASPPTARPVSTDMAATAYEHPPSQIPTAVEMNPKATLIGGSYELKRQLGSGGMGEVYEAIDVGLDRKVALKKMRHEIGLSPRGKERFLSEARTVAKLMHPNIVQIHAIVEDKGDLYLVLEHVDGWTLDQLLQERKKITPDQAVSFFAGVAAAVDYAHTQKIIHRDLKPSNIMIDKAGHAKVMDFGIAHQAKLTVSQVTMAEAAGTQPYMPPEQELGKAVRESDVFAFAAVAYEALTGELPFPGPNFHLQKVSMAFERPSGVLKLPKTVDPVFERALDPEPKKRHATTRDFVDALHRSLV